MLLPDIIRGFKDVTARRVACLAGLDFEQLWEHDHFERLIESDLELADIHYSMVHRPAKSREPLL